MDVSGLLYVIMITLEYETQALCVAAGITRHLAYKRQYEGNTTKPNFKVRRHNLTPLQDVIDKANSAAAECVVAFHQEIQGFYPKFDTFREIADVGDNIEVKHTQGGKHLIIRPGDRNGARDVAVLVTGFMPTYYIEGWMPLSMIRVDKYWRVDSWWVNKSDLFEMKTLARSVYATRNTA